MDNASTSLSKLQLVRWIALAYTVFGIAYLAIFVCRFYALDISAHPSDWVNMAGMLTALFGPPLALWSIYLVLASIQLQQEQVATQQRQYFDMLERENRRLDPLIREVEPCEKSSWGEDTFADGKSFCLTVQGDAAWLVSSVPGGPTPVAIGNRDGSVEVVLWSDPTNATYWGLIRYQRANGTEGAYRLVVIPDRSGSNGLGFSYSRTG